MTMTGYRQWWALFRKEFRFFRGPGIAMIGVSSSYPLTEYSG